MGKKTFCALLWLMCAVSGFCASVSFQIVQHNDSMSSVCNSVLVIEDEILNSFFNSGYIVSNSPVFIKEDSLSDSAELKRALADTLLGGMDVLVRLEIKYDEKTANSAGALLPNSVKSVSWQNYNPKTGKIISDGSIFPEKVDASNNNEAELYKFASSVAAKVSSTLKSLK